MSAPDAEISVLTTPQERKSRTTAAPATPLERRSDLSKRAATPSKQCDLSRRTGFLHSVVVRAPLDAASRIAERFFLFRVLALEIWNASMCRATRPGAALPQQVGPPTFANHTKQLISGEDYVDS